MTHYCTNYFAYCFAYFAYYRSCIFYILHILTYFAYYTYIYVKKAGLTHHDSASQFIATIACFPMWGPSCLRTTTYIHRHCYGIYHRQLLENRLILSAFQRVSFQSLPVEQVVGVQVWRILEWHTVLVIVHGARTRWWTHTHQPMLWQKGFKICKICKICWIC